MKETIYCIGHCCYDKTDAGFILGGSVSYGALLAKKLKHDVSILTSVEESFLFTEVFSDQEIGFYVLPGDETTIFKNINEGNRRVQYLLNRARRLEAKNIPEAENEPTMVFLAPIADELDFDLINHYSNKFIVATIQGWLRTWDEKGLVSEKVINWNHLSGVDLLIISSEDVNIELYLDNLKEVVKHIVITNGDKGTVVYKDDEKYFFDVMPTEVIDTTGAGDIFAMSYAIQFKQTEKVESACLFAHAAASLSIEDIGASAIPSEDAILKRMNENIS